MDTKQIEKSARESVYRALIALLLANESQRQQKDLNVIKDALTDDMKNIITKEFSQYLENDQASIFLVEYKKTINSIFSLSSHFLSTMSSSND